MSVHFFYNYKASLVEKLEEHYQQELDAYTQEMMEKEKVDKAQKFIVDYFTELKKQLTHVIAASEHEVFIDFESNEYIVKFQVLKNYVKFTRKNNVIEVKIGKHIVAADIIESNVQAYILPGDKKCIVKKKERGHDGAHFDENTLNAYLKDAFGHIFDFDVEEK